MKLFNENPINLIFQKTFGKAINEVGGYNENELFKENSQKITNEIFNIFKEKPLEINFTKKSARVEMTQVLGKFFPAAADVNRNQNYTCAKVIWTFKIIQGSKFLNALPTNHRFDRVNADVDNGNNLLHISYQTLYARAELSDQIKKEVKNWISDLVPKMENTVSLINNGISEFNKEMKPKIEEQINKEIAEYEKKNKQNDDLADF
jgi:hypothetical protein